jgi:hypothetical protein
VDKIVEVAGWMAYEELPMPEYPVPTGVKSANPNDVVDLLLVANCIDTAFSDFSTHVKFQVDYEGHWSDSDAMFACLNRAIHNGIPVLDGAFLAEVSRPELETASHTADSRYCMQSAVFQAGFEGNMQEITI